MKLTEAKCSGDFMGSHHMWVNSVDTDLPPGSFYCMKCGGLKLNRQGEDMEIATHFGVQISDVRNIKCRRTWRHLKVASI